MFEYLINLEESRWMSHVNADAGKILQLSFNSEKWIALFRFSAFWLFRCSRQNETLCNCHFAFCLVRLTTSGWMQQDPWPPEIIRSENIQLIWDRRKLAPFSLMWRTVKRPINNAGEEWSRTYVILESREGEGRFRILQKRPREDPFLRVAWFV